MSIRNYKITSSVFGETINFQEKIYRNIYLIGNYRRTKCFFLGDWKMFALREFFPKSIYFIGLGP